MDSGHSSEKTRKKPSRLPVHTRLEHLNVNLGQDHQDHQDRQDHLHHHQLTEHLSVPQFDKKSTSEPELNSSKHWAIGCEGFPPGVTVDELKQYRRRRQPNHLRPQDNLHLEDVSQRGYKTEYKRRYQAYSTADRTDSRQQSYKRADLPAEGEGSYRGEYRDSYRDHPRERPVLKRPQHNLYSEKDRPMESVTEKSAEYIWFIKAERAKLLRRSTALKMEGEMTSETEVRRAYREYPSPERARMVRRPPSFKLEGNFENMTSEQKDKFISYLLNKRPILEKKHTELKMEGDFSFLTEKELSYVAHDRCERPHVRKRSTSLKLDGEVEFHPEYKNSFVDFPRSRPVIYRPNCTLRNEGELEKQTETKMQYINFEHVPVPETAKRDNNLHVEGQMEINPEYKENFVNFPRERPFMRRPESHLKPEGELEILTEKNEKFTNYVGSGKHRSEIARRPTNLKLEGDLDLRSEKQDQFGSYEPARRPESRRAEQVRYVPNVPQEERRTSKPVNDFRPMPEYQRSYVNFPRERPVVRRPVEHLRPNEERFERTTEKSSMYVPHKVDTPRRRRPNCNLKPEGELEAKPEYNAKFLDFPRHRPTAKRPRENLTHVGEFEKMTEKSSQYVSYGTVPRETTARRPENLKLEGVMEKEPEYRSRYVEYPVSFDRKSRPCDNLKRGEDHEGFFWSPDNQNNQKSCSKAKTFPAFQVLDVKGQVGCQSNPPEMDKSSSSDTSSVNHPTYRLEVYNVDEKNQGFHKNGQRVFPNEAVVAHTMKPEHEKRLAAVDAARKRRESFSKVVKSPEIPKFTTEENNNVVESEYSRKSSPEYKFQDDGGRFDENSNDRAFLVLDNSELYKPELAGLQAETFGNAPDAKEPDPRQWAPPAWMTTA